VYSFGRAALLLLVEVQNHTVPVRERGRIRVNNDLLTLQRAVTQLGTCYAFHVTGCNSHGEITDVNASQLTCIAVITNSNCLVVGAVYFWRVQVNQNGLKLIGTHQLLVYDNDVNILGDSVYTVKKKA